MQRAVQMPASFLVHRHPVHAGIREYRNKFVGIFDHQVAVERQLRNFAQRLYDRRPNREIRNEVSIHHIHVDDTRSTFGGGAHLLA
jgi:hypothetical protein